MEDFLDVKIEEITLLERTHLLTNKAMIRMILKKGFDAQDLTYIESKDEHIRLVNRTLQGVREDALAEGEQIGLEKGEQIALVNNVIRLHKKGKSDEEIADLLDTSLEKVKGIIEKSTQEGLI